MGLYQDAPPFREDLLTVIHQLVELPISHGLIGRMRTLESLLVHFEAKEFAYYDVRGKAGPGPSLFSPPTPNCWSRSRSGGVSELHAGPVDVPFEEH